jgi:hypothetical protein
MIAIKADNACVRRAAESDKKRCDRDGTGQDGAEVRISAAGARDEGRRGRERSVCV